MIALAGLKKKWTPNQYLVCPDGYAASPADAAPDTFKVAPDALIAAWREVVEAQARTKEIAFDAAALRAHHTQQSKVMRFTDDIVAEAHPAGEGASHLYVYSRSRLGIRDFGVNKARVEAWLDALRAKLAA